MTWRELWKSTVTNLRALLGFSPPSKSTSAKSAPLAPVAKRRPPALPGPVANGDRADLASQRGSLSGNYSSHHSAAQTIDLTPTRALPHPSAPLRTRKPPLVPVDVALDAAAFAATQRAQLPAVVAHPASMPEMTWNRQGVAQIEQPVMEASGEAEAFDQGDTDDGGGGFDDSHVAGEDDEGVALTTLLESLLFVASEPVEPRQLAQTLDQSLETIELGLAELTDYYQRSLRGLRLQRFNGKVQLVTASAAAPFIEAFLNLDSSTRLSSPALETLAVIAYRQPVTRAQIEAVRGVDCSGVLRSLVQRRLVAEVGRMEGLGRPILYGVTELFMQHFGLMEMGELPPLEETEADRLWAATVLDEQDLDSPNLDNPHADIPRGEKPRTEKPQD